MVVAYASRGGYDLNIFMKMQEMRPREQNFQVPKSTIKKNCYCALLYTHCISPLFVTFNNYKLLQLTAVLARDWECTMLPVSGPATEKLDRIFGLQLSERVPRAASYERYCTIKRDHQPTKLLFI
jgi:hypothetical protein